MNGTVEEHGLTQFLKSASHADRATSRIIRGKFREAGDIVKRGAASRFQEYDARSAAGYRTVVRQRGVAVEQSLRKTTGLRPDFGRLQMEKALMPAAETSEASVVEKINEGLVELTEYFGWS